MNDPIDDTTPEAQAEERHPTVVQASTEEDAMLLATEDFESPEWQAAFQRAKIRAPDSLTAALARVAKVAGEDTHATPSEVAQAAEETAALFEEYHALIQRLAVRVGVQDWLDATEVENAINARSEAWNTRDAHRSAELKAAYDNLKAAQERCKALLEENRKLKEVANAGSADAALAPDLNSPDRRAFAAAGLFTVLDKLGSDKERPITDELTKAACRDVRAVIPTKAFEEAETVVLVLKARWSYAPAIYMLGRGRD